MRGFENKPNTLKAKTVSYALTLECDILRLSQSFA
jgi:hypothetical protein